MASPTGPEAIRAAMTDAQKQAKAEQMLADLPLPKVKPDNLDRLKKAVDHTYTSGRYAKLQQVGKEVGIDPDELVLYTAIEKRREEDMDRPGVSEASASGEFQITDATRKLFAHITDPDPYVQDAKIAAHLIKDLRTRWDPTDRFQVAAYNAGEGTLRGWAEGKQKLGQQTINYLAYAPEVRRMIQERKVERARLREENAVKSAATPPIPEPEYGLDVAANYWQGKPF
jgi:hypothetical protein